jgi:hypothetical protein
MAHRRSLGCARDDKKERVSKRERTVAKGQGGRRGGGGVDKQPLLRENQKKSHPLRMTTSLGQVIVVFRTQCFILSIRFLLVLRSDSQSQCDSHQDQLAVQPINHFPQRGGFASAPPDLNSRKRASASSHMKFTDAPPPGFSFGRAFGMIS